MEGLLVAVVRNVPHTLFKDLSQRVDLKPAMLVQEFLAVSSFVGWKVDVTDGSVAF
jgi:hypothetical protein